MKSLLAFGLVLLAPGSAFAELVDCHVVEDGEGPIQWLAFDTSDPVWTISPDFYEWGDQDYRVEIDRHTGALKAKQRGFGLMEGTCTFVPYPERPQSTSTSHVRPGALTR